MEANKDVFVQGESDLKLNTDAYGMAEARKLWDHAFIDVIGLALAIGEPQMAFKLGELRYEAGFTEKIDWEKL